MRRVLLCIALLAPLAACDPAPTAKPAATTTAAPDPIETKIDALPPKLQQTTLFRAIRDGGFTCQQIVQFAKKPTPENHATWVAECEDHGQYVITLQPGGVFWSGSPCASRSADTGFRDAPWRSHVVGPRHERGRRLSLVPI